MGDVRGVLDVETVRGLLCVGALAGLLLGPAVLAVRWGLARSGHANAAPVSQQATPLDAGQSNEQTTVTSPVQPASARSRR
jgi:hypothetical protein